MDKKDSSLSDLAFQYTPERHYSESIPNEGEILLAQMKSIGETVTSKYPGNERITHIEFGTLQ